MVANTEAIETQQQERTIPEGDRPPDGENITIDDEISKLQGETTPRLQGETTPLQGEATRLQTETTRLQGEFETETR